MSNVFRQVGLEVGVEGGEQKLGVDMDVSEQAKEVTCQFWGSDLGVGY